MYTRGWFAICHAATLSFVLGRIYTLALGRLGSFFLGVGFAIGFGVGRLIGSIGPARLLITIGPSMAHAIRH